jgi:hypothetical protein
MSGKKGMLRSTPKHSLRRNIWRTIRIMRAFTLPDIMRTVPQATEYNVRSFLIQLHRHHIIAKNGGYLSGRSGTFQQFRLLNDFGPTYPTICPLCGQSLSKRCEKSVTTAVFEETETKKETEQETEKEIKEVAS